MSNVLGNINNMDLNNMNLNNMNLSNMGYNMGGFDSLQIPPQQRQIMQQVSDSLDFVMDNRDKLFCGEDCQKNEKTDDLYQSYLKAQTNLVNAPKMLKDAEKNYIMFTKGGSAYNQMVYDELKKEAKINTKQMKKKMNGQIQEFKQSLTQYSDQYDYVHKLADMENIYQNQIRDEEREVERIQKSNSIADRHVYYDTQWLDFWNNVNQLMWIILAVITGLYVVIGVGYKKYTSPTFFIHILIMMVLLFFPFVKIIRIIQDLILWK